MILIFVFSSECKPDPKIDESKVQRENVEEMPNNRSQSCYTKLFNCSNCKKDFHLSTTEILRHRKTCKK